MINYKVETKRNEAQQINLLNETNRKKTQKRNVNRRKRRARKITKRPNRTISRFLALAWSVSHATDALVDKSWATIPNRTIPFGWVCSLTQSLSLSCSRLSPPSLSLSLSLFHTSRSRRSFFRAQEKRFPQPFAGWRHHRHKALVKR